MAIPETLADVRGFAAAGRIVVTSHAERRMEERGAASADVRHALVNATGCTAASGGGWKVHGPDLDGAELVLVVLLEGLIVVRML